MADRWQMNNGVTIEWIDVPGGTLVSAGPRLLALPECAECGVESLDVDEATELCPDCDEFIFGGEV